MTSLTYGLWAGIGLAACAGLFVLQCWQASRFLHCYGGPPLTWSIVTPVFLAYMLTSCGLLLHVPTVPGTLVIRGLALLVLAVPLTLTDLRCQWLPMRYTVLFWLGGLCSAAFTWSTQSLSSAAMASICAFLISALVRYLANLRQNEERIGLGDVYLMAGLCAWLPWRIACHAAGGGLLLCCLWSLMTRQSSRPLAPALFGFMCGVSLIFPQQLAGVL
ncbi:prepilin peptidase [Pantoea ananatis]|uniref:prepilin peptidase n=1 Tax=Pantoea ananas TaxID=553 RepID=UPI003016C32D